VEAQSRGYLRVVLCLLMLCSGDIFAYSQPVDAELTLRAGRYLVSRNPEGALQIHLSDGVELIYQERRLLAESLQLDTERKEALTESPFMLIAPEGTLRGERLRYEYERGFGRFENFRAEVLKVIIRGAVLEGDLSQFTAYQISATTCENTVPDYVIEADSVRLTEGVRLRLRNARLKIRGRTVLSLPFLTVRVRETAQILELPSPVYRQPDGWGMRSQLELPIGSRTVATASGTVYFRALPETRLTLATALTPGIPYASEPELRARFEASALYNLRIIHEQEQARLAARTPTLRLEQSTHIRPLFAPERDTRLSRSELALEVPFQTKGGAGALAFRIGSQAERVGSRHTPRTHRATAELEWRQSLFTTPKWELWLLAWASHTQYGSRGHYAWLRPNVALRWRPAPTLSFTLGYGSARVEGSTPFLTDQLEGRNELIMRAEGVWGNLRGGVLMRWDTQGHTLNDLQLQVGWRIHCIEPTLFWRRSPSTLLLGINLTAFL